MYYINVSAHGKGFGCQPVGISRAVKKELIRSKVCNEDDFFASNWSFTVRSKKRFARLMNNVNRRRLARVATATGYGRCWVDFQQVGVAGVLFTCKL